MPIRYTVHAHLAQPPAFVYDFMVVNQPANHPRWEPEVLELRRDGPPRAGTRGVMVRRDFGKVTHQPLEWLEIQPGKRSRFVSDYQGVRFDCAVDLEPDGSGTSMRVSVEVTLSGFKRLLQPIFGPMLRRNSLRILERLRRVLDEEAGHPHHDRVTP
jgi:hypothetical protein